MFYELAQGALSRRGIRRREQSTMVELAHQYTIRFVISPERQSDKLLSVAFENNSFKVDCWDETGSDSYLLRAGFVLDEGKSDSWKFKTTNKQIR